jgi:hypothetical protein
MECGSVWRGLRAGGLLTIALVASGAARAELLRCTGPDGKTIYTDDKSVCPEAEPFEPAAVLHGTERQAPVEPSQRRKRVASRESAPDADAGQAEHWRGLRSAKQEELRQIAAERAELKGYVAWCNRGGSVVTRDQAGIKQKVRCDQLRDIMAALDTRKADIDEYLEHGLPEECRRAGCLPGWIR